MVASYLTPRRAKNDKKAVPVRDLFLGVLGFSATVIHNTA